MKNLVTQRTTLSGSVAGSHSFGILEEDQVAVIGILRDTIYSDKILAVLREYGSNAWDAHRSVGRGDLPIDVVLPTEDSPLLRIRDHGPGLSQEDVFQVYTQYGRSTKRGSNDAVGMLGIGSKSGFAYADSFTVTSWFGGQKSIFIAALDSTDRGVINLVHQEACDPADTGVEVQVAVQLDDVSEFEDKARGLYRHFSPRPNVNTQLPELPADRTALASGSIDYASPEGYHAGEWVAVMGCVPYRVRLNELDLPEEHACLRKLSGTLQFGIGEVQVAASREDLRYTAYTKAALVERFTALVDEYTARTLKELDDAKVSPFEKRKRLLVLSALDLPLPDEYEELTKSWVKIFDEKSPLHLVRNESATNQVTIDEHLRFLVDDTGKKLAGYSLGQYDYVVRPAYPKATVADVEKLLAEHLEACLLTGVPIVKLSTLYWSAPPPKHGYRNPDLRAKHKAKMFRLVSTSSSTKSDNWEVVERVPEATDVYVVIESFKAYGGFEREYRNDQELAKLCGAKLPEVYGYKTTEKKPVDRSTLAGTDYASWREAWVKSLLTPTLAKKIALLHWCRLPHATKANMKKLVKELGGRHPIVKLLGKRVQAEQKLVGDRGALADLAQRLGLSFDKSDAAVVQAAVSERYPLLALMGWKQLTTDKWDDRTPETVKLWFDYVRLVDQALTPAPVVPTKNNTKENQDATDTVHAN